MGDAKLWWISWEQFGEDYRPVKWPPPAEVVAYWCTGYNDTHAMIVAIIRETSQHRAKQAIKRAWAPGVDDWRFAREYVENGPPGDRFPPPEWSVEMGRWPW